MFNISCARHILDMSKSGVTLISLLANRKTSIACLTILLSATLARAADKAPVMITPGAFSVSATGAATYSIPIAVPPGTAGMVPSLSLDYNSQAGNGLLGVGWTLSGLPTITRCPRTIAQDGNWVAGTNEHVEDKHGGIDYDSNDRFCLDGQRLIASSGTYGADGTVYRTELDGFSKITSHGTGSSPDWFEVRTKAGQVMQFGNTTSSRIMALSTSTPRLWAVNRISDTKHNYLDVIYTNDTASGGNGQFYPSEIDYTGNTATSLSPYNSVVFEYEDRYDVAPKYEGGYSQSITKRLTNIKTKVGTTLVSNYVLTYNTNDTTTRNSELLQVQLCDVSSNCLAPTTFGWQGTNDTLTATPASTSSLGWQGTIPAQWNGDGLTDSFSSYIAWQDGDGTYAPFSIWTANSGGTFSSSTVNLGFDGTCWCLDAHEYHFYQHDRFGVDINGDGVTDFFMSEVVIVFDENGNEADYDEGYIYRNDGSGTLSYLAFGDPSSYNPEPGDFDGDGRTDIWVHTSVYGTPGSGAQLLDANGTIVGDLYAPTNIGGSVATYIADFNGDGCTDILTQSSAEHKIYFECNHATQSVSVTNWSTGYLVIGDFNGDGKADILNLTSTGGTLNLSTGTGFVTQSYTVPSGWGNTSTYTVVTGDWNGDGKTDIGLIKKTSGGTHDFYLSNGTGFPSSPSFTISNTGTFPVAQVGDWNSDGVSDVFLGYGSNSGTVYYFGYTPELITSINNGLNVQTLITYDRINKGGSFYAKDSTAATYPTQDLIGPMYVVKQADSSNGLGTCTTPNGSNCYTSTYAYVGAKTNLHGRGFLGFHKVDITDSQTGIVQETVYRQDFPYIGMVDSQTKKSGSLVLSNVANTYCDSPFGSAPGGLDTRCTDTTGDKTYFVFLQNSVQTGNDLDSTALPTVTTTYGDSSSIGYDAYGNVLKIKVATQLGSDTASKTTTNTYATADTTNWILGRLATASTVASFTGTSDITRTSSFDYDSDGLLTYERIEPSDGGALKQVTHYTYDSFGFGNRTQVDLSGNSITTRTSTTTYESTKARFPITITNPLSQSESWGYDERFGLATSQIGPNGIETDWTYDGFGRKTNETRFVSLTDTNYTQITYDYCTGFNSGSQSCPSGAAFVVTATPKRGSTQNGPQSIAYYDRLSRLVAADVQGFYTQTNASCWIRTTTEYDSNGRIYRVSRPSFTGSPSGCPTDTVTWVTNTTFDTLGRATLVTNPNGGTVATSYSGLTTTVTASVDSNSANNQTTTTVKNVLGLVKQVTDANSKTTKQDYDAYGDLIKITDSLASSPNITRYSYDTRGRKLFACEPDKIAAVSSTCDGSTTSANKWSFTYDAFGELLTQTDAKGQTTTFTYDAVGRPITRTENNSSSVTVFYTTWTFGTSSTNHDIGKLTEAKACTSSSSCAGANLKSDRVLTYDSYGRPSTTALTVSGASQGTYTTAYDSDQNVATVTYPSGFEVQYSYTSLGFVYQLKEYGTTNPLWTADERDAQQHLTREETTNRANGNVAISTTRTFDPNTGLPTELLAAGNSGSSGALTWSTTATPCTANCWGSGNWTGGGVPFTDLVYAYDYLGKMTSRQNSAASTTESFCYDKLNRLTDYAAASSCTGTGAVNVAYDEIGNITKKSDVCTGAGCYAYASSGGAQPHAISSLTGTFNGASNPTFAYDSNGNMTSGAGRSVVYTVFNMSSEMTQGTSKLCWDYDADHQRARMDEVSSCGSSPTSTTYYLYASGMMSEKIVSGSNTTYKDYLLVGGVMVGLRTKVNSNTPAIAYFVLDHQGSVVVTTDETGLLVCRIAYDPWGKSTASGSGCTAPAREFLGQESINTGALVNLVNLNARVYDPVLGRFMGADPMANPFMPQSLNLYTYGLNSPLWLSDPSGLCFLGCFWQSDVFRVVIAIAVAVVAWYELPALLASGGGVTFGTTGAVADAAAAGSAEAASALVETGAIAGGLSGAISTGTLKGALIGAGQGVAFAEIGGLYLDTSTVPGAVESAGLHGLVGGLASVASGGNFGSGFIAAGFSGLASPYAQTAGLVGGTAVSAVVGGVGSILGGGKFANGAETGAFGYLFNELLHPTQKELANGGSPFNQQTEGFRRVLSAGFGAIGLGTVGGWAGGVADLLFGADVAEEAAGVRYVVNSAGDTTVDINGTELSTHAAEQATARNISMNQISDTMANGYRFSYVQNGETLTGYYSSNTNTFVGVGNRITTVIQPSNPANYLRNLMGR